MILVTVWLGFPYMFLVTSGALQAIPDDLKEAARVDGATSRQVFWRITFPLLMVSIAPLLIASFAFNFNNFINIFLLTEGGPPIVGLRRAGGRDRHPDLVHLQPRVGQRSRAELRAGRRHHLLHLPDRRDPLAISFRFTKTLEEHLWQ